VIDVSEPGEIGDHALRRVERDIGEQVKCVHPDGENAEFGRRLEDHARRREDAPRASRQPRERTRSRLRVPPHGSSALPLGCLKRLPVLVAHPVDPVLEGNLGGGSASERAVARVHAASPGCCRRREFRHLVGHTMRRARIALTAGDARNAPRTSIEAIVARARSGGTSSAMLASPMTRSSTMRPDSRNSSRSRRL
jgi:hypothetical protein